MQIDVSKSELDLIIIALKGFIDDNELYAENVRHEMPDKDLKNLESLNLLTEQLIDRLESSAAKKTKTTTKKKDVV